MRTNMIAGIVLLAVAGMVSGNQAPQEIRPATQKERPGKEAEPKPLTVQAQLTNADPFDKVRTGSHHKVYTYKMVPGRSYVIRMDSNQLDSYLRVEDSKGTQLAADDDSGGNLNAKIVFTPTKADTYRIIATTFGAGMVGNYTLTVRPSGPKKIVLNVNGQITNADPFDVLHQASHHRLHTFKMAPGKSYNIQLTTNQFAPCVRLEDALGNQINQAVNGAGSATLEFTPTRAGNYRIIVTTLGANQTGNYTLTVAEQ